jgi:uncharacterized protein involved in type VI secretion and phage assembly
MPGRVCVRIPVRDQKADELQWVKVVQPWGGKSWGHYVIPEVGDQVLLAFEGGKIEKPYIIGCLYKEKDSMLSDAADADNQIKQFTTKHGNTIRLTDKKDGDGDKDSILVKTPKDTHQILLDNEAHKILLSDKKGENKIEMDTEGGEMTITAKSRITIKCGDVKLSINGETNAVKLDAAEVSIKASKQIKLDSDGKVSISASQLMMKAAAAFKAECDSLMQLAASLLKLG